jgi:hypothetical protein
MKSAGQKRFIVALGLSALLAGCGGGGGSGGSPGSQATLSADQAASEQFLLAPNASYSLRWNLPFSGAPVNGTNYFTEAHATMAASPLTAGPQKVIETSPTSIANTLGVVAGAPARYLINGAILVGSTSLSQVSYQGTGVRIDALATDGVTVVGSTLRTNYSVVPLSGLLLQAPAEFVQYFNSVFSNSILLKNLATWSTGAAYVKFTGTQINDLYTVVDYTGITTGNAPTPVATGTTIAAMMAAGGITSSSDATTYTLANGSVSVINGVTTYVASNVRPKLTTPTYRTYYELNGNVYVGDLIKAGTVEGGNPYLVPIVGSTGYTVNYTQNFQIRLNAAAFASLHAAVMF